LPTSTARSIVSLAFRDVARVDRCTRAVRQAQAQRAVALEPAELAGHPGAVGGVDGQHRAERVACREESRKQRIEAELAPAVDLAVEARGEIARERSRSGAGRLSARCRVVAVAQLGPRRG
jgi:hypothetical protein